MAFSIFREYYPQLRQDVLNELDYLVKENCFRASDYVKDSNLQRDMIAFVQKNYGEKVSLSMLAEEFHLSEKYVSWYFKEHFSISFTQYITHLRMTRAKDILLTTEQSITEVALSCGYQSVNLFIRNFKEMYGVTPLKYRKQMIY